MSNNQAMDVRQAYLRRGLAVVAFAAAAVIAVVAVVVASPWLMKSVAEGSDDWHELSDVGQAYGGVSAILSGLAFCGIAVSLLLQWRQVRLTRTMTERERHFDLVQMAMDDPSLLFTDRPGITLADRRKRMYINLWVSHWAMLWQTGSLDRTSLRDLLDDIFRNELARAWWVSVRSNWTLDGTKRSQVFKAAVDEAHGDAELAASRLRLEVHPSDEVVSTPSHPSLTDPQTQ